VPPSRGERHPSLFLEGSFGLFETVELTVGGEYPPARSGTQVYSYLRQGGVDAVFPEVGVLLQAPDRLHGLQRHLPHARRAAVGPVFEAVCSLLDPPLEDPVDGGLVYAEVAGDGLRGPSLGVERDHRQPALAAFGDLVVRREAPRDSQWDRLFGQDAPDSLVVGSPAEEHVARV
jgi:hypothetical protein